MPRRTLGLTTLQFKRDKKRAEAPLDEFSPFGLLTMFHEYAMSVDPDRLIDKEKKRYTLITNVVAQGCAVFVDIEFGHYGSTGKTYNITDHKVEHTRSDDHSATILTRLGFVVPPKSKTGVFFTEREGITGGGARIVERFKDALITDFGELHHFPTETVVEAAAWRKDAELSQIKATARKWRSNIAAGSTTTNTVPLGTLRQELVPDSGVKYFPRWLRDGIMNRQLNMTEYLGFDDDDDVEVVITLEKGEQTKKFVVGKEKTPSVRILLTEDGQPSLDDQAFRYRVFREAESYYTANGFTWQHTWEQTNWPGVDTDGKWDHSQAKP